MITVELESYQRGKKGTEKKNTQLSQCRTTISIV